MTCLICLVSVMIYICNILSAVKRLFMGHLRIVLVFATLTIALLISESLLGNTHVTMAILPKCLGTFSQITITISLTLIFRKFILNFDVRYVSCKFTIMMSPLFQIMITDVVYLISSAWDNGKIPNYNWCCVRRI